MIAAARSVFKGLLIIKQKIIFFAKKVLTKFKRCGKIYESQAKTPETRSDETENSKEF